MYHYTGCGLKNVFLANGYRETETPYGKGVSIVDLEGLHDTIAKALVSKPAPLSGEELRFLRNELDLSQKTLAKTLGISDQSIARWEKQGGASPEGDRLIRLVYAGTKWGDKRLAPFIEQLNRIEQKQGRNKMVLREHHNSWEHQAKAA